jgi:TetR/AcrR family transcriptional regulator, regulator of mycofactocin system
VYTVNSVPTPATPAPRGGRQPITTTAQISHVAFQLFITQGYEETTVDEIARACGIGRRTLFRYFPSKNDIPWGEFDTLLDHFSDVLHSTDPAWTISQALRSAIIEFNTFPPEETPYHRARMDLLLNVPTLLGHSTLRYRAWREVIQRFVGFRLGCSPDAIEARTVAWVSLGLSLAAYEQWLATPHTPLAELLDRAFDSLETALQASGVVLPTS